eukprot:1624325-Pyramimonas_sp.AAC.1
MNDVDDAAVREGQVATSGSGGAMKTMGKPCVLAPDSSSRHAKHRALRLELVHIGLGKRRGSIWICVSLPLPRAPRAD